MTAASARTASSGVSYDGTDPLPSPGTRRASGTPGMPRNVETTVLRAVTDAVGEHPGHVGVGGPQRRDEQRDHRVDAGVGEDLVQRCREVGRSGVRSQGP